LFYVSHSSLIKKRKINNKTKKQQQKEKKKKRKKGKKGRGNYQTHGCYAIMVLYWE